MQCAVCHNSSAKSRIFAVANHIFTNKDDIQVTVCSDSNIYSIERWSIIRSTGVDNCIGQCKGSFCRLVNRCTVSALYSVVCSSYDISTIYPDLI